MTEETKTNGRQVQNGSVTGNSGAPNDNGTPSATAYQIGAQQNGASQAAPQLSFLQKLLNKGQPEQQGVTENAFTKLFGKPKTEMTSPAPATAAGASTSGGASLPIPVSNGSTPSLSTLLGPKPKVSLHAISEDQHRKTKFAKGVLSLSLLVGLSVYGFFYAQLNPNFTLLNDYVGPNVAAQFERSNSEVQKVQTDLNLVRFRLARLGLDEVNSNIDPFQQKTAILKSEFSTNAEKNAAAADVQVLGASIKNGLTEVQKILSVPFGIDTFSRTPITVQEREENYKNLLLQALSKQKEAISGQGMGQTEEIRVIDNVLRLVENAQFRRLLTSKDFGKIAEADFSALLTKIREEGTDELSMVDKIRRKRIDWARAIQDIHSVTRKADLYYGQGLFKTVGGFLFSSYNFDSKTGRVSIAGQTKTSDSKTFSFIAKLVDSIEKSPKFQDIDFRSFSKNKEENGDYSSALSLDFAFQLDGEIDPRDDLLQEPVQ